MQHKCRLDHCVFFSRVEEQSYLSGCERHTQYFLDLFIDILLLIFFYLIYITSRLSKAFIFLTKCIYLSSLMIAAFWNDLMLKAGAILFELHNCILKVLKMYELLIQTTAFNKFNKFIISYFLLNE